MEGVTVAADRGYWFLMILLALIKAGANIFGTVKRDYHFPFCYGRKLDQNDNRTDVKVGQGGRVLQIKQTTIEDKIIAASAFRDGTNKVVLSISSEDIDYHWELIPRCNCDCTWYNSASGDEFGKARHEKVSFFSYVDCLSNI